MFIAFTHTTAYDDPQTSLRTFTKEADARAFVAERNDVLAWPGSGNFHKRLARCVEVKGFRLRAAEQRVVNEARWLECGLGSYKSEERAVLKEAFERACSVAIRHMGATPEADAWGIGAYTVGRHELEGFSTTIRVSRLDGATLSGDEGELGDYSMFSARSLGKSATSLVWGHEVKGLPAQLTEQNAVEVMELVEQHLLTLAATSPA